MKTTTNIKSKVMKAAWTIYRKYKVQSMTNWSKALKKAWAWAKKKLVEPKFNIWSPRPGFYRLYVGQNYIQMFIKSNFYTKTAYYKLVGISQDYFNTVRDEISNYFGVELELSRF